MAGRRQSRDKRCEKCNVHFKLCYCDRIKAIELNGRVSVIQHFRERFLTSNSIKVAELCLNNIEIIPRGLIDKPIKDKLNLELNKEKTYYLYPSDDALILDESFRSKNYHLIIPDGTWSQAKKIWKREPLLSDIQCVKLPTVAPSIYSLRKQHIENAVSSFEALAYALGFLEEKTVLSDLLENFKIMVNAHQSARDGVL